MNDLVSGIRTSSARPSILTVPAVLILLWVISCPVRALEEPGYPYCYYQLTEAQQHVYADAVSAIWRGLDSFEPEAHITPDEAEDVMLSVYTDQPQFFWLKSGYSCEYAHSEDTEDYVTLLTLRYNDLVNDLDQNIAAFDAAANEILDGLYDLPDYEKERIAHNRLAERVTYIRGDYDQNAYSALCLGESVCSGYTRAFQYLMNCLDIPSCYCEGTSIEEAIQGQDWASHSWNIVKLGEGYYNVDVTWDDTCLSSLGVTSYAYFNQPDSVFDLTHRRTQDRFAPPACEAGEYTFESIYGIPAPVGSVCGPDLSEIPPVVSSIEEFYQLMYDSLVEAGTGSSTICFVVCGEDCENAVLHDENFSQGYLTRAAEALGLNGYSYSFQISSTDLKGGYYYSILTADLY